MKSFLKSDLFFKIISVVAAAFLWLYVINYENPEFQISVSGIPVKFENTEALAENNLVITSQSADTVTLKINGRRKTVSKLDKSDVTATIDLQSVTSAGEYVIPAKVAFSVNNVSVADGTVPKIRIIAENEVSSELPVSVVPTGAVKEGYFAVAGVSDATVTVLAPESMSSLPVSARAEIDVTGASATVEGNFPVKLYDANGAKIESQYIKCVPSEQTVFCNVYPVKEVPVTWTAVGYMPENSVSLSASVSTVKIAGPEEILSGVESVNIGTVNLSSFTSYNNSRTFNIKDSESLNGLYVADGTENITVSMRFSFPEDVPDEEETPEESTEPATAVITVSAITLRGVPDGFTAELLTPSVSVSVSGTKSDVSAITAADFSAVADLSGVTADGSAALELDIPLSVTTEKNVTVSAASSVRVRISPVVPAATKEPDVPVVEDSAENIAPPAETAEEI